MPKGAPNNRLETNRNSLQQTQGAPQGSSLNDESQIPWTVPWSEQAVDSVSIVAGLASTLRLGLVDWQIRDHVAITPFQLGIEEFQDSSGRHTHAYRPGNSSEFPGNVAEIRLVVGSDVLDRASYEVIVEVWKEEGSPRMRVKANFRPWPEATPLPVSPSVSDIAERTQ